jgi:hypothetical protein
MALIRNILLLTFEEVDTFNEKQRIRGIFEGQGYRMIAETKIERTGIVKEWIMESPVQYGKFGDAPPKVEGHKKIYQFDPTGGQEDEK